MWCYHSKRISSIQSSLSQYRFPPSLPSNKEITYSYIDLSLPTDDLSFETRINRSIVSCHRSIVTSFLTSNSPNRIFRTIKTAIISDYTRVISADCTVPVPGNGRLFRQLRWSLERNKTRVLCICAIYTCSAAAGARLYIYIYIYESPFAFDSGKSVTNANDERRS